MKYSTNYPETLTEFVCIVYWKKIIILKITNTIWNDKIFTFYADINHFIVIIAALGQVDHKADSQAWLMCTVSVIIRLWWMYNELNILQLPYAYYNKVND